MKKIKVNIYLMTIVLYLSLNMLCFCKKKKKERKVTLVNTQSSRSPVDFLCGSTFLETEGNGCFLGVTVGHMVHTVTYPLSGDGEDINI